MKTPFFYVAYIIFLKDLRAELRSREMIGSMLLFALLSILIFSFALELDRVARQEAISGVLWVTVVFASILGLNRSMVMEREQANMDALLMAPIDRAAIFIGKAFANMLFALAVGLILLPVMTILYNITMISPAMLAILLLGTAGISITGTLLAAMTVQTRAREALLPIALLPVVLPLLLGAVRASTGIISGAPFQDWGGWLQILLVVDLVYLLLCFLMFEFVIEE